MLGFQVNIIPFRYFPPYNPRSNVCKWRAQSEGGLIFSRLAGCGAVGKLIP